jgi:hypothetical protein
MMKYKLQYVAANKVSRMPVRIPRNFRHIIKIMSTDPAELLTILLLTHNRDMIQEHGCIFSHLSNKYIFYFANINDRLLFLLRYL